MLPDRLTCVRVRRTGEVTRMQLPGVNVFARFKAKPGLEDRVRRALLDMIEPTLQENANVGHALHASTSDPTLFLLYEQWNDESGLREHMAQTYFSHMEDVLSDALEQPMEVVTAHLIAGETAPTAAGSPTA